MSVNPVWLSTVTFYYQVKFDTHPQSSSYGAAENGTCKQILRLLGKQEEENSDGRWLAESCISVPPTFGVSQTLQS